jgi:dipeptidyl aminopeptidase/acylaminoacyl peptidase
MPESDRIGALKPVWTWGLVLAGCAYRGEVLLILPESGVGYLHIDPEGRNVAYSLQSEGGWRVVRGTEEGPLFDEVSWPFFGPGGRLVYFSRKGRDWRLQPWGEDPWPPIRLRPGIGPRLRNLDFSADGRSIAYVADEPEGKLLMIDGRRVGRFEDITELQWCEARECFGAIVFTEEGCGILIGREIRHHQAKLDYLELAFTRAGEPFVRASDGDHVYFGHPERLAKADRFHIEAWDITPEGRSLAYVAEEEDGSRVLVVDGEVRATIRGRVARLAIHPEDRRRVVWTVDADGRYVEGGDSRTGPFERVGALGFAPGSADVVYIAGRDHTERVVVADRCTPEFDAVDYARFEDGGRRIVVCGRRGREVRRWEFDRRSLIPLSRWLGP